jgi:hypothetical protein
MSDSSNLRIEPTPPVRGAGAVQPVRPERHAGTPAAKRPEPSGDAVAATTGGTLRAAYAQIVVNPDTHDVVLRILDSATDAVLNEYPSKEVQAMSKGLQDYASALARRHAAVQSELAQ